MKWFALSLLVSFSAFAENNFCKPLEIGQSFTINASSKKSKSDVEQKYSLKRDSEYEFSAYLNFDFKLKGSLKNHPEFTEAFKQKVEGCFRKKEHKLVDEMGRKIKLHVFDPSLHQDIPAPKAVSINLQNTEPRSDSRNYFHTASCETIVHEALHLMGLMDEYEEKWLGKNTHPITSIFKPWSNNTDKGTAFDCRAIGPDTSIMHNNHHMDYFKQVFFSGHADAIIYPNCERRNDDYYACAKLAYKTNKKNTPNGCGEVRDICKTQQWVYSKESPERTEYDSISINQSQFEDEQFSSSKNSSESLSASRQ